MRLLLFVPLVLLMTFGLNAQPLNDDCETAIDLTATMSPYCDSLILFNNLDATPSEVGQDNQPPCFKGGTADNDVWFSFTTNDAIEYDFIIQGHPDSTINDTFGLFNPEVAFYIGGCDSNDLEMLPICFSAPNQVNRLEFTLDNTELQPNTTYFMRINASGVGGINNGSFWICIKEIDNQFSVDEVGSDFCEGRLYDTGGPNEDYGNNEEHTFTICPADPHECLSLTMGNYELFGDSSNSDYFKIYDGQDTNGLLIGASFDMRDSTGKNATIDFNNAVCQMFYASSGCMTIVWKTDSVGVGPGFDASWVCSQDSCPQFDSLQVVSPTSNSQIVDAIQGRLIEINVGEINCIDSAYATFVGDNSDLGMDKGLLLTTGHANAVGQPNHLPNMGFKNDTTGIDLLDSLSLAVYGDTTTTHDGCAIDLEFTPDTDVMALEFTMGSEEYPECIDEQMSDIMGLFYSTAGYMGDPRLNNHDNIARLPNDSVDIQISTINPSDSTRWVYYRNMLNSQSIEYDGMIANGSGGQKFILLTQNVEPCQANNLITAIADRGDSLYDSGIFITNMRCLTPTISLQTSTGLPFFIEECNPGDDFIIISYPRTYDQDTEWTISFEGDAQEGTDFEWTFGSTIIQPAGQMSVSYPIDVINDMINEGPESFTIKLTRDWGCGEVELTELEVIIRDRLMVDISTQGDFCKGDSLTLIANQQDLDYLNMEWSPSNLFEDPMLNVERLLLENDVQIILTGTIIGGAGCQWMDTIDITVIDPQISINALDPTGICFGESVRLQATDNVSGTNRLWFPDQNISSTTEAMVTVTPDQTTTYSVTVDTANCEDTASITIDVERLAFPAVIEDTTICAGEAIALGQLSNPNNQSIYDWMPPTDLDDPNSPTPIARPGDTTTYSLKARTTRGYCEDSATVTINVIDVGVDIVANEDTIYICLGDTTELLAQTRGQGVISWSPNNGVIGSTDQLSLSVSPQNTTTYTVTYTSERCSPQDQITVVVDRLPENGLQADPSLAPYCKEDTTRLFVDFGGVDMRNSSFVWSGGNIIAGQGTPSVLVSPNNTTTYRVRVINGACEATYEKEIAVVEFNPYAGDDVVACEGDTVRLDPLLPTGYPDSIISYTWTTANERDEIEILDPFDPNSLVVIGRGGTADLTITIGSCEFGSTVKLENSNPGALEFVAIPDSIANCDEVTARAVYSGNATSEIDFSTIEWNYVDTSGNATSLNSEDLSATHSPNTSGQFVLTFIDSNGCPHRETTNVSVFQPQFAMEEAPNAFTPNGDGVNDVYRIKFQDDIEYDVLTFKVINRWGQIVFEADDNVGWDGTMDDGSDALSEVYLVVIEFIDTCGNRAGDPIILDVTLIR